MTDLVLRLRTRIDILADGLEVSERERDRLQHQNRRLKIALRDKDRQYRMWKDRALDAEAQVLGKISARKRRRSERDKARRAAVKA